MRKSGVSVIVKKGDVASWAELCMKDFPTSVAAWRISWMLANRGLCCHLQTALVLHGEYAQYAGRSQIEMRHPRQLRLGVGQRRVQGLGVDAVSIVGSE